MVILEISEATYKMLLFCVGYATGFGHESAGHS